MDFTPELSAFQGAILSADNVHQFSTLSAKGGNEDAIEFVVDSLSTFLQQGLYIVEGTVSRLNFAQVRKFALYIVLNADLPELQQLIDSDEICTLIWTTPTIPKCLMSELMWNLHMDKFISEIISYSNPQLAIEVAGAFLEHFKYFEPLDCLEQLQLLSVACYTLICRLHTFEFEQTVLQNKSAAAFNNFQQCLKYYTTPPNNHKLNDLSKVELYKYQGKSIYSLFQLMDECLLQFTGKLDAYPAIVEIYKLTYAEDSLKKDCPSFNLCESSNNVLLECLNNANTAMLDTCKVLVMDVSVDVFCCWSELEENDKNMQQTIGELCYKVHNKLSAITTLSEHPLVTMLEQIYRKPVEMKEKINATEDSDIIKNINNNNEESKEWIKALVYKEKLCQSSELLNIVYAKIDMYDENECYQLYTILKQYDDPEAENKDLTDQVLVKAFEKFDIPKKFEILQEHFKNKIFVDMEETPQFRSTMTSVFNKLIESQDIDLADVLTLFIQNPQEVLLKIFHLASENTQQSNIMLKVVKSLERFADHFYCTETESCVIQTIQKVFELIETEAQEDYFIQFVCGLKNDNIISGTKLLLLVIMTNLHKALLKIDIIMIYMQLKLLQEAFELQELMNYRAPMLAMIGQVLDVVRWQIDTYCPVAPTTFTLAVYLQTTILESYDGEMPENEVIWLKSKLRNLKPMNMYYYRELWEPQGCNYFETISGITLTNELPLSRISGFLSQVICSCTQEEWCEIYESLSAFGEHAVLNVLHTAVVLVTVAEKSHRTEQSGGCIFYCYRNFMYVIRHKFLAEVVKDDHVLSIIKKAAMITEVVDEEDIEEFGNTLMPVFAYLTEKQEEYNVNLAECFDKYLVPTKLSPMINKIFLNGSA